MSHTLGSIIKEHWAEFFGKSPGDIWPGVKWWGIRIGQQLTGTYICISRDEIHSIKYDEQVKEDLQMQPFPALKLNFLSF